MPGIVCPHWRCDGAVPTLVLEHERVWGMKRWCVILLSVLAFAFMGTLVWRSSKESKQQFIMPDGRVVTVEAITYGSIHAYSSNPDWRNWLYDHSPQSVKKWVGEAEFRRSLNTPVGTLVIWLSSYDPKIQNLRTLNGWTWFVSDEHGCPLHNGSASSSMMGGRTTARLNVLEIQVFPRSQREITLTGYNGNERVEVKIPNPYPVEPVKWKGQVLPQTVTQGSVQVTLKQLRYVNTTFPGAITYGNFSRIFQPDFEVVQNGAPISNFWYYRPTTFSQMRPVTSPSCSV